MRKSYKNIVINKKNKSRKMCMDVEGGFTGDNGRIISYPCHNGPNQKFHYNRKTKQLRNKLSQKCIELKNGLLIQNKCNRSKKTQKFYKHKKNWVSCMNKYKIREIRTLSRCREQDPNVQGDLVVLGDI